jgi:hypothetical protein
MEVDDAKEAFVALLQGHPVTDRPEVVAEVEVARRLDPAEDPATRIIKRFLQGYLLTVV